jgi:hypothetical protein
VGVFAVDADVKVESGALAPEPLDDGFVGVAAIGQRGDGRAEARGDGGEVGFGLAHVGGAEPALSEVEWVLTRWPTAERSETDKGRSLCPKGEPGGASQ